jgi:hypothetical protein
MSETTRQKNRNTHSKQVRGGQQQDDPVHQSAPAGISNRESSEAEERDRREHPPIDTSSPPPEDAAGRSGEQPLEDHRNRHTSHKAGSRSIAQKEDEARYPDRSMPPSRQVAGAFGREPQPGPEGGTTRRPKKHR